MWSDSDQTKVNYSWSFALDKSSLTFGVFRTDKTHAVSVAFNSGLFGKYLHNNNINNNNNNKDIIIIVVIIILCSCVLST